MTKASFVVVLAMLFVGCAPEPDASTRVAYESCAYSGASLCMDGTTCRQRNRDPSGGTVCTRTCVGDYDCPRLGQGASGISGWCIDGSCYAGCPTAANGERTCPDGTACQSGTLFCVP